MKRLTVTAALFAGLLTTAPGYAQTAAEPDKQKAQSLSHADAKKQPTQSFAHGEAKKQPTQSFSHADPSAVDGATKQH